MNKIIKITNIILSIAFLLLLYIPKTVRNNGFYVDIWYDGFTESYGSFRFEFSILMIIALIVLIALTFSKYYFATIIPAIINISAVIFVYIEISSISNTQINDYFSFSLIVIVAICIVLISIYQTIDYVYKKQKSKTITINKENSQSNADELKKFKELLDIGAITQEEFDQKKKQLLGL